MPNATCRRTRQAASSNSRSFVVGAIIHDVPMSGRSPSPLFLRLELDEKGIMLTLRSLYSTPHIRFYAILITSHQSSRGPRTHNNNSTPYAKGRPPRNPREREHDPNHNRYGAIELIDRPSESSRGLLSRMDDHAPRNAPPSGPSRPRTTRPAPEGKTTIKSINAEVKTMQRKALPKYNPDLHTPEVTKWLSARFNVANGILDMSVSNSALPKNRPNVRRSRTTNS